MAQKTILVHDLDASGGTLTLDPDIAPLPDVIIIHPTSAGLTLAADFIVQMANDPPRGTEITIMWDGQIILDIFQVTLPTLQPDQWELDNPGSYTYNYEDAGGNVVRTFNNMFSNPGSISGLSIIDATIPIGKFATVTDGSLVAGGASNVATELTVAGVLSAVRAGATFVFSYVALSITNAAISTTAAIARSKLANGTNDHVLINSGAGAMSSEALLATTRGGLALNTSASTGVPTVSAGTWSVAAQLSAARGGSGIDNSAASGFPIWTGGAQSVAALTDVRHIDNLSFVTANQGTYYLYFPFPCTVTNINIRVTSVLGAADVGELTIANNSGAAMTGSSLTAGVLTLAISAPFGTGYSSTLLTNNTFTAGQSMRLTTAKVTTGGVISAEVTYTRTSLS